MATSAKKAETNKMKVNECAYLFVFMFPHKFFRIKSKRKKNQLIVINTQVTFDSLLHSPTLSRLKLLRDDRKKR